MQKLIKRGLLLAIMLVALTTGVAKAQNVALKTNAFYWATAGSPNVALELKLSDRSTLDLYGGFNLWEFNDPKRMKHWLAQPELRLWTCEAFNGLFFGLHAHGAQFNVGGWDIPVGRLDVFKDNRYEGWLYGAGLSVGNSWVLSPRLNLEASIGGGYARIHYNEYPCVTCGTKLDEGNYNYWGITRATLSLVYFFD